MRASESPGSWLGAVRMNRGLGKPKVEILTIHFGINHGSVLQCYALSKTLRELGAEVEVVDYVPARYKMWNNVKIKYPEKSLPWKLAFLLASSVIRFPQKVVFRGYLKKHLALSRRFSEPRKLADGCPDADLYLVGSDQVWNSSYNGREDKSYLLGFAPQGAARASYAASIGKDELTEEEGSGIARGVQSFSGVSVREERAAEQLANFGVEARVDLDPVFLLDRGQWCELASTRTRREPYVLVYVIAQGYEEMVRQAREIADRLGARLYILSVRPIRIPGVDRNFLFTTPSDFLALFRDAAFVVSNSFHGTAFSIIFRKRFLTYAARYNARIENILSIMGLGRRLVTKRFDDALVSEEIDYVAPAAAIAKGAESARAYLRGLLEEAAR